MNPSRPALSCGRILTSLTGQTTLLLGALVLHHREECFAVPRGRQRLALTLTLALALTLEGV